MHRGLAVRAPNLTFERRHRLPATRSVWFVEVAGHTQSDTMVFLTDSEILFAGDILSKGVHPSIASGRLDLWRDALAGVQKIAPKVVIPGHGPVTDVSSCAEMGDYLAALDAAGERAELSEFPERFRGWLSPSVFEQNLLCLRRARTVTE
jgi:glyoxylase-like metal-dependent hydrolase (beta-lactamase superfamily II)